MVQRTGNGLYLIAVGLLLLTGLTGSVSAQEQVPWHDPSPHKVQFVSVDKDVKLEVLDWGGSGQPLVFLAGLGDTAHVFDEFAPKFTPEYRVYGITRRGYGASSVPAIDDSAYSADRLGDDVLAVLDDLKIDRPVLVGHSIAGEELSSVATRHPERVAGLIYLDAAYEYAYYSRSEGVGNTAIDLLALQRALEKLQKFPPDYKILVNEMVNEDLPAVESDLREMQKASTNGPPVRPTIPPATDADKESFAAFHSWWIRVRGLAMPESELHQLFESTQDGRVGKSRNNPTIVQAVNAGEQKYTHIRVPALAIFALPHDPGRFVDPATRIAYEARDLKETGIEVNAFEKGVPSARVVRVPKADHYVFFTNEADVIREMHAFLETLH